MGPIGLSGSVGKELPLLAAQIATARCPNSPHERSSAPLGGGSLKSPSSVPQCQTTWRHTAVNIKCKFCRSRTTQNNRRHCTEFCERSGQNSFLVWQSDKPEMCLHNTLVIKRTTTEQQTHPYFCHLFTDRALCSCNRAVIFQKWKWKQNERERERENVRRWKKFQC